MTRHITFDIKVADSKPTVRRYFDFLSGEAEPFEAIDVKIMLLCFLKTSFTRVWIVLFVPRI